MLELKGIWKDKNKGNSMTPKNLQANPMLDAIISSLTVMS
jgi:hypothetical protein